MLILIVCSAYEGWLVRVLFRLWFGLVVGRDLCGGVYGVFIHSSRIEGVNLLSYSLGRLVLHLMTVLRDCLDTLFGGYCQTVGVKYALG